MNRVFRRVAVLGAVAAIAGLCAVGTPAAQAQAPTANPFGRQDKFCVKHTPAPGARNTSDPGVKPDSILLVDAGNDQEVNARVSSTFIPFQGIFRSYIEEINSCGGINGRKIILKRALANPTAPDVVGMVTANCLKVTEDYKAFAVMVSTNIAPFPRCAAIQHKTIVHSISPGLVDSADMAASKGRLFSNYPPNDAQAAAFVKYAISHSMFKGKRVMVLGSQRGATNVAQDLQDYYVKPLKAAGIDAYVEAVPCLGTSNCRTQVDAVVSRAKASGTDYILASHIAHASTIGTLWKYMFEQGLKARIVGPISAGIHVDSQLVGQVGDAGAAAARSLNETGEMAYVFDEPALQSAWRYGYKESPIAKACMEVVNRRLKNNPPWTFAEKFQTGSFVTGAMSQCNAVRAMARAIWSAGNNVTTEKVAAALAKEPAEKFYVGLPEFRKAALYSASDHKPTKMAALKFWYPCPITAVATPAACMLPADRPIRARSF